MAERLDDYDPTDSVQAEWDAYHLGAQEAFAAIAEGFRAIGAPALTAWVEEFAAKVGEQRV